MLSFRNSLTHPSLSSIISRRPPCPADHSFKMYEMFLSSNPALPARPLPTPHSPGQALCGFLQQPPGWPPSLLPLPSRRPRSTPPEAHMQQLKFPDPNIQWDSRSEPGQAGPALLAGGEETNTIQVGGGKSMMSTWGVRSPFEAHEQ